MHSEDKSLLNTDIPMGLGMALARNMEAMQAFSAMDSAGQQAVIERTHTVGSKKEMQALVDRLGRGETI